MGGLHETKKWYFLKQLCWKLIVYLFEYKMSSLGKENILEKNLVYKDRGSVDRISLDQNCHFSLDRMT
jgi:hypothetical protein